MLLHIALAPGYLPGVCNPCCNIIAGGGAPLPLPLKAPLPLPLPPPMPTPGIAKSGFAALASRITSSGLMGRPRPGPGPLYGPKLPAGAPISGRHAGFTGRWDTDVKCEASLAAGEREPSGRSSYELVRGRLGSRSCGGLSGAASRVGFEL
jgi:hypothetical protein